MQINISSNADEIRTTLTELERRQLPFATARALTLTAQDAREAARGNLRGRLRLRNKYSERGVRIRRAEKADWPRTQAVVGIDQDRAYLVGHESGEIRRGVAGHRRAVPTRLVKRTSTGKIPKNLTPRALRAKRGTTKSGRKSSAGGGTVLPGTNRIVKRKGRGRKAKLLTFYHLVDQVRIKKGINFVHSVHVKAGRVFDKHFKIEFAAAVKSARVRKGGFTKQQVRFTYLLAKGG